jgi:hypothetical protein
MENFKLILVMSVITLMGCSPQTNDRIVPSSPSYTNAGLPNPLVLFNGYLATGLAPNVYEYPTSGVTPASTNITLPDTSVKPIAGQANILDALINYNGDNWVGFPLYSPTAIDLTSGNYSQVTFYVKGAFTTPAGSAPVTSGQVGFSGLGLAMIPVTMTTSWQAISLPITGSQSSTITDTTLFMANFYAVTISAPVTAYIDQIQYQ